MPPIRRESGVTLVVIAIAPAIAVVTALTAAIARSATGPRRATESDQALAIARETLIAYATSRPIDETDVPATFPAPTSMTTVGPNPPAGR